MLFKNKNNSFDIPYFNIFNFHLFTLLPRPKFNSPDSLHSVRVLRRQEPMKGHLGRTPARSLPVVARPVVGPIAAAGRNARRRVPRRTHPLQRGPLEGYLGRRLPSDGHILDVGAGVLKLFKVVTLFFFILVFRRSRLVFGVC